MQHGFPSSQQSLISGALLVKKQQSGEDSEDDCNVDADIGEEYNMS
jgi:hypothetical protein